MFSLYTGIDQTNWEYSNDEQRRVNQNCKLHEPQVRGSGTDAWAYSENAIISLFLYTLGHRSDILLKYIVMITKEGLPKF